MKKHKKKLKRKKENSPSSHCVLCLMIYWFFCIIYLYIWVRSVKPCTWKQNWEIPKLHTPHLSYTQEIQFLLSIYKHFYRFYVVFSIWLWREQQHEIFNWVTKGQHNEFLEFFFFWKRNRSQADAKNLCLSSTA